LSFCKGLLKRLFFSFSFKNNSRKNPPNQIARTMKKTINYENEVKENKKMNEINDKSIIISFRRVHNENK